MKPTTRLGRWHRSVLTLLRQASWRRVRLFDPHGSPVARLSATGANRPPVLIVSGHRCGAFDGLLVQAFHPTAVTLLSTQLVANPYLRLLFTGIPIARPQDRARGKDSGAVPDAVAAAAEQLRSGGDLVMYPEGTSTWSHSPQPFHRGTAAALRRVLGEGHDVTLIPVAPHYERPTDWQSRAELVVGRPITLRGSQPVEPKPTLAELAELIETRVRELSVDSPTPETFAAARAEARARIAADPESSYAAAFLRTQRASNPAPDAPVAPWPRRLLSLAAIPALAALVALHWPTLLAGWLGSRAADGRNVVMLHRILTALPVAALTFPIHLALAIQWPWLLIGHALAVIGFRAWGPVRDLWIRADDGVDAPEPSIPADNSRARHDERYR